MRRRFDGAICTTPAVSRFARLKVAPTTARAKGADQGCRRYKNQILIANPRLTFDVSRTKHRVLKISNRERIAIFCSQFRAGPRKISGNGKCSAKKPPSGRKSLSNVYVTAEAVTYKARRTKTPAGGRRYVRRKRNRAKRRTGSCVRQAFVVVAACGLRHRPFGLRVNRSACATERRYERRERSLHCGRDDARLLRYVRPKAKADPSLRSG
jgi:hypothetical protein